MDFSILGPLDVRRDGESVDLRGARQRAVLSRLLVARREVVAVDRLIEDLWSGDPSPSALGVLQAYISHLRRALEPDRAARAPAQVLVSRAPGYALAVRSDADEFADLLHAGTDRLAAGDAGEAADVLGRALEMWRGEPYADVADEAWAGPEVSRLTELRLIAHEHHLGARISLGQAHRAVPELEQLVAEHPLREGLWRLLALALYRTSRQADALNAVRRARVILREELGLDPSPALRDLETSLLEQSESLGGQDELTLPTAAVTAASPGPDGRTVAAPGSLVDTSVLGRSSAWAALRDEARSALGGAPRAVQVVGEAGIGKTWMVRAFASELADEGWSVRSVTCHDVLGAPALWPWVQLLGDLDRDRPLPDALRPLVTGTATPGGAEARFKQHESVRHYLVEVASKSPLLLVLDDVQWADAESLELLADVLTQSHATQILAVVSSRPSHDRQHDRSLARLDRCGRRVPLTGLGAEALTEMARASGQDVSGAQLLERTGGNPLFARETLRLIERSGVEVGLSRVPESVADLVGERFSGLAPESQRVLEAASVLGRELDLDILLDVSGEDEEAVWDGVDDGTVTGLLIEHVGAQRLAFAHDLVREAVYNRLAPQRRSRLHAEAVAALQRSAGVEASRLAAHAWAAGPAARGEATHWSAEAARQASGRLAHRDAARWWARAVESQALERDGDRHVRVELLLSLLRAQVDAGDAVAARETRNLAVVATEGLADRELRCRTLVALDAPALWLLRQFDEPELRVVNRLEQELTEIGEEDGELRCRMLATLAEELYDGDPDPRCEELSREAIAMARRLDRPDLLVVGLNARYIALNREGLREESRLVAEELIEVSAAHRWPAFELLGHLIMSACCLYFGDVARADDHARSADRLIGRLDLLLPRMQGLAYWVGRRQLDGRFDEAAALLEEFGSLGFSWWAFDGLYAGQKLTHRFVSEQLGDTDEALIAAAGRARPSLAHDFRLLQRGPAGGQVTWPDPAPDWGWLVMTVVRAEAVARYGDDVRRRATYDQLTPFAGRFVYSASFCAPVDWYLARLATSLGETEAARHHLAALATACRRESLDWWGVRATAAHASLT